MPQFLKKASLGRMVVATGGASDPELVEVRLTKREYEDICEKIENLNIQISNERVAHQQEIKKAQAEAVQYKKKADAEAARTMSVAFGKVAAAETQIEAAKMETQRQTNLNNNLLRIMRERANAKRGLQPKKTHSGYRFSGKIMQTKTVCGYDKAEGALYADVWTAILETPYDGTIPIHQIEDHIFSDLMGTEGILSKLYINYWCFNGDENRIWKGKYQDAVGEDNPQKENYLFDYKFMVNPKTRLWEVQITTTKSIKALSEMMQ